MKSAIFVLVLTLTSALVYSMSIEEKDLEMDEDDISEEDMRTLLRAFIGEEESEDLGHPMRDCKKRRDDVSNRCEGSSTAFKCCKNRVSVFYANPHKVCVSMVYLERNERFEVVLSTNGKSVFVGRINLDGNKDINQKIVAKIAKKHDAILTLRVACQNGSNKKKRDGCIMLTGEYDRNGDNKPDKVDVNLGCFSIRA